MSNPTTATRGSGIDHYQVNPWQPMDRPRDIAVLAKLGEELGELVSAKDRCLAQGINERHPETQKMNILWLEEELADVQATIDITIEHFGLRSEAIKTRKWKKLVLLWSWLNQLL